MLKIALGVLIGIALSWAWDVCSIIQMLHHEGRLPMEVRYMVTDSPLGPSLSKFKWFRDWRGW